MGRQVIDRVDLQGGGQCLGAGLGAVAVVGVKFQNRLQRHGQAAHHRTAPPDAQLGIADHHIRPMQRQGAGFLAQLAADDVDILARSGQEDPALVDVKALGKGGQLFGRVIFRVQRDRDEEHVPPHAFAQPFIDLRHPRGGKRAEVGATGVEEVDHDDAILQHIVEKGHFLALGGDQGQVGEILRIARFRPGGQHHQTDKGGHPDHAALQKPQGAGPVQIKAFHHMPLQPPRSGRGLKAGWNGFPSGITSGIT